jgi:hypothetical protein
MRCPHLEKDIIYNCTAGDMQSPPGGPCVRKYCKSEAYLKCPHFVVVSANAHLGFFRMTA